MYVLYKNKKYLKFDIYDMEAALVEVDNLSEATTFPTADDVGLGVLKAVEVNGAEVIEIDDNENILDKLNVLKHIKMKEDELFKLLGGE